MPNDALALVKPSTLSMIKVEQLEQRLQFAAGGPDPSFGESGHVVTSVATYDDGATAVAIQSDGKIVVGGVAFDGSRDEDFALVRYLSNGKLDSTFGDNGKVVTDFGGGTSVDFGDNLKALAIQ